MKRLTILIFLILITPAAFAATQFDFLLSQVRSGSTSLANGKVYFYAAGTSTPKMVWLDINATTPAANPYTLDANGTAQVYGTGLYRVVVKDSSGVTKFDRDSVSIGMAANITGQPIYPADVVAKGPIADVRNPSFAGGAKCDGDTNPAADDTAAIQAAIDAAAPQGKVQLCKGTAVVSQLRLPSYVELAGYGIGSTVLKQKSGSNKDMIVLKDNTVQMVTLHDFSLDGNKANQTSGNGINLTNTYTSQDIVTPSLFGEWDARHQIRDIYIQKVKGTGVIVVGRGETQLSNVEARYCDKNSFYFAAYDLWADRLSGGMSGEHGLVLEYGYNNVKLSNSKMWMSGRIDTTKGNGFHVLGARSTLTGCEAQDNAGYGIALSGGDTIVTGFIAEANGWYQNFYGAGSDYRMTDSAGIYINSSNNIVSFTSGDRFSAKQDRAVWIEAGSGNIVNGVSHNMSIEAIPVTHLNNTNKNRIVIGENKIDGTFTMQSNLQLQSVGVNQSTYGITSAYIKSKSDLGHVVGPIARFDTDTNQAGVFQLEKFDAAGTDATKKRWNFQIATSTGDMTIAPLDGTAKLAVSGTVQATTLTATTGGSANHAICWKADGKTLGYCSAVVAADGTCGTCN